MALVKGQVPRCQHGLIFFCCIWRLIIFDLCSWLFLHFARSCSHQVFLQAPHFGHQTGASSTAYFRGLCRWILCWSSVRFLLLFLSLLWRQKRASWPDLLTLLPLELFKRYCRLNLEIACELLYQLHSTDVGQSVPSINAPFSIFLTIFLFSQWLTLHCINLLNLLRNFLIEYDFFVDLQIFFFDEKSTRRFCNG